MNIHQPVITSSILLMTPFGLFTVIMGVVGAAWCTSSASSGDVRISFVPLAVLIQRFSPIVRPSISSSPFSIHESLKLRPPSIPVFKSHMDPDTTIPVLPRSISPCISLLLKIIYGPYMVILVIIIDPLIFASRIFTVPFTSALSNIKFPFMIIPERSKFSITELLKSLLPFIICSLTASALKVIYFPPYSYCVCTASLARFAKKS